MNKKDEISKSLLNDDTNYIKVSISELMGYCCEQRELLTDMVSSGKLSEIDYNKILKSLEALEKLIRG